MASSDDNPVYAALVRLKPEGMTLGRWATEAGLARNFFNLVRQHGNPKHESLEKLLDVAGVSWAEFDAARAPGPLPIPPGPRVIADPFVAFRTDRPRDVPVRGTPSCGEVELDGGEIETVEMDVGEIIDYVRRPAALDGRRDVYAIYFTGFSMEPKFEQGDVAYVDATRPPSIGDYVVVQLKAQRGEDDDPRVVHALVKRLVRRSAAEITLEQFNPARTFRVPASRVAAIHRIFPMVELVAV